MKNPLVSIIIPAFNSEATIRRCLESILHQSYTNYELIIVDNYSKDNTNLIIKEYVPKFSRIKFLAEHKKGRGAARYKGEINASGDVILMTDADCIVPVDWIEEMIKPIIEDGEVAVQGIKRPLNPNYWTEKLSRDEQKLAKMRIEDGKIGFLDTANFAIEGSILKKIGYTDPNIISGNDAELMVRLLLNNYKLCLKEISVLHSYTDTGWKVFKKTLVRGIWRGRLRMKYRNQPDLFPVMNKRYHYTYICSISRELRNRHPDFAYNFVTGIAWRLGLFLGRHQRQGKL
jgi:glycosyltransferase involved in cell wall biosynthesis